MTIQKITKESIESLGLDFGNQDLDALVEQINAKLNKLISDEITEELDSQSYNILLEMGKTANKDEIFTWLKQNIPEFDQIVQDNIDIVLGDLADNY